MCVRTLCVYDFTIVLCEEIAHQISAISRTRCPMKTSSSSSGKKLAIPCLSCLFSLSWRTKKSLPDLWLPQHSINVVLFTRSDDDILELRKKRTMWQHGLWWQPHSRTWKLVLGLLPPIIGRFWLSATILQLNLQNIRQENLKLIF